MKLKVTEAVLAEQPVRLRLPFRFGAVTLQQVPQAHLAVRVESAGGASAWGLAAELLVPKWFDKDPRHDEARNLDDLRSAVGLALDSARAAAPATAFGLSVEVYRSTQEAARGRQIVPLAAGYGPALLDRAVLDGLCRITGRSFFDVMHANLPGFEPGRLGADQAGVDGAAFLRGCKPVTRIQVRHTVGMLDPLRDARLAPSERVDDALPQALDAVIARYGHRYFKLKIGGDPKVNLQRLTEVAAVLDHCIPDAYQVSLDGNEQYTRVEDVVELLGAMTRSRALSRLVHGLLFVEQPLHRANALCSDVDTIARLRPVAIDESDGDHDAFVHARQRGYQGVSSKQCKGLYKSMLNALRVQRWNAEAGDRPHYFLTGEDLSCQAGICVQQDLALVSMLGLRHVERNAHHYAGGLARGALSDRVLECHPHLYTAVGGRACLNIVDGGLRLDSLTQPGFACAAPVHEEIMRGQFPGVQERSS